MPTDAPALLTPTDTLDTLSESAMQHAEEEALRETLRAQEATVHRPLPLRHRVRGVVHQVRHRARHAVHAIRGKDTPEVAALRAAAGQEEAVHATMDALGVPRERHGQVFTLTERVSLFVDRLSERLHSQVENNMLYFNLCREVVVLLRGAPNSGNFRTQQAIAKLEAVTIAPKQAARVQSLGVLES